MGKKTALRVSEKDSDLNWSRINRQRKQMLDRWINRTVADLGRLIDLTTFRILGFLFAEKGHTKAQIVVKLKLWEELIDEKLKWLIKQGFIRDKRITFGIDFFGNRRTIRVYYITELGRVLLHHLDMQFPGLWMGISEMEAENCEYNK
ncbi:MAG: hypothetical protein ACFFCW_05450 [Candidatus Hodarchaeota archaeon]